MAQVTFQNNPVHTSGNLPAAGQTAPAFTLAAADLSDKTLADFAGKRKVLNIFPSVDTGVCAQSVRTFNKRASSLDNAVVLCISADLPFAQARFCGAEGLDKVVTLSSFRSSFATDYGVTLTDSPLRGLTARGFGFGRKRQSAAFGISRRNHQRAGLRCGIGCFVILKQFVF